MSSRVSAFGSSVGTKILVGLTGLALFLYLITHIAGNLLVVFGPTVFNEYAHTLLSNPLLPVVELGLAAVFIIHIYKTVRMFLANQQARPVRYVRKEYAGPPSRKSVASSTMIVSGLWLLVFVLIHVKQFKYGANYVTTGTAVRDLYRLEVENFASPLLVAFYVISMVVVGSHLWHGVGSALQSLGADDPTWTPRLLWAAKIIAVLIAGGFIFITLWVHFTQVVRA
jgi:succinate dehydrogenase / fumarate reductase, cytochrome b subunit